MSLRWSQHFWLLPCVNNLDQGSSFTFIKLECKTSHRLAGIPPACETNGPVLFTVKIPPIASEDIKPPGFTFITRPWPCSDSRISLNTLYVRDETLLRKRGRRGCCDWQESRDQMSINVNSQSLKASIRRLLQCAAKFFFCLIFLACPHRCNDTSHWFYMTASVRLNVNVACCHASSRTSRLMSLMWNYFQV